MLPVNNSTSNLLTNLDRICDYIPFVSTFSNLIDLYRINVTIPHLQNLSQGHEYWNYLLKKDVGRCKILLFPVVGNVIIAVKDFFGPKLNTHPTEIQELPLPRPLRQTINLTTPKSPREEPPQLPPLPNSAQNLMPAWHIPPTNIQIEHAIDYLNKEPGTNWTSTESGVQAPYQSIASVIKKTELFYDQGHIDQRSNEITEPLDIWILSEKRVAQNKLGRASTNATSDVPMVVTHAMLENAAACLTKQTGLLWLTQKPNTVYCTTACRPTYNVSHPELEHLFDQAVICDRIFRSSGVPNDRIVACEEGRDSFHLSINHPYIIERLAHMGKRPIILKDLNGKVQVWDTVAHRLCATLGAYKEKELAQANPRLPLPVANLAQDGLHIKFPDELVETLPILNAAQHVAQIKEATEIDETIQIGGEYGPKRHFLAQITIPLERVPYFVTNTLGLQDPDLIVSMSGDLTKVL